MRELSFNEINFVAGGHQETFLTTAYDHGNYDVFWTSFAQSAGWGAGAIASIPVAIGMAVYVIAYYGIYTPCYYIAYGAYSAVSYTAKGIYALGSGAVGLVVGN